MHKNTNKFGPYVWNNGDQFYQISEWSLHWVNSFQNLLDKFEIQNQKSYNLIFAWSVSKHKMMSSSDMLKIFHLVQTDLL